MSEEVLKESCSSVEESEKVSLDLENGLKTKNILRMISNKSEGLEKS